MPAGNNQNKQRNFMSFFRYTSKRTEHPFINNYCRIKSRTLLLFIALILPGGLISESAALERYKLLDSSKISDVWSGHPVDFALVEMGNILYMAYYDSSRKMTVAKYDVSSEAVTYKSIESTLGWDSHNFIAMALDSLGYIHVSGNMHSSGLVYFRSTAPYDIQSLVKSTMTGQNETNMTYPVFFRGNSGELIFTYRDGTSGNGNQLYNVWNHNTKKWTRLFGSALIDGEGLRNAYTGGPYLGPDGYYHMYWMWRETADAGTTHDVCYIRSKDLVNWENAAGTKLTLPVKMSSPGVFVDTIAQNSGLINRGAIGFDSKNQLILTYHQYDNTANKYTQLYNARREGNQWKIYQTSDWAYQWSIGGTGTLVLQVTFGAVIKSGSVLTQSYYHVKNGTGVWELDETTLKPKSGVISSLWPSDLEKPLRTDMVVHWLKSQGPITCAGTFSNSTSNPPADPSVVYALRWETMPENQDKARDPIPAATKLMLYKFKDLNNVTSINKTITNAMAVNNNIKKTELLCNINSIVKGNSKLSGNIYSTTGRRYNSRAMNSLPQGIYIRSIR